MNVIRTIQVTLAIIITMVCGCSRAQNVPAANEENLQAKRVLVVYLSRTNNTKAIAEMIHNHIGGKLVSLEIRDPYPSDYGAAVAQVARENETGFLPVLKTRIDSMQAYDVVFIGFPTWGMQLPPPVKSFLHDYKLDGKTVIPFNTNAGYGIGTAFDTIKTLCPNSTVLEGFSIKGGVERDGVLFVMEGEREKKARSLVEKWLRKIQVINK